MRTFLTLAFSLFSITHASPSKTPTYVCTTLDNTDRFDYNATAFEFPEKWFRTSYNGACVYDCEPYQAIGDFNVGFHVSCGTIDVSKMVEMDATLVTIPPYLYSDYSDGTFKSFEGSQEYTICVYKNTTVEGSGGDCGYREDTTRALKKALAPKPVTKKKQNEDRLLYKRLRYKHSQMLKKYQRTRSKTIVEEMKKVREKMKVLLMRMQLFTKKA